MKFRLLSIVTACFVLFSFAGCKANEVATNPDLSSETASEATSSNSKSAIETGDGIINPLTGIKGLSESAVGKRPVAIMINNISVAQDIQAGLSKADIIYEAYAEGGITRLLAVFKDVNNMPRVGSVRSARYSYVDLAMGHDAIYTHAGKNKTQCEPYMASQKLDNFDLNSGTTSAYGFRVQNGKSSEHTLYTDGKTLSKGYTDLKWRTTLNKEEALWQNFVDENSPVTPNGGTCTDLSVKMSGAYISNFKYDSASGKYIRSNGKNVQKDYNDGSTVSFKNVLVLKTTVTPFANDPTNVVKTHLEGGDGYYVSNGGYVAIKWSKGAASNPLKITLSDGSAVSYNAGNTFVCLVDKNNAVDIKAN